MLRLNCSFVVLLKMKTLKRLCRYPCLNVDHEEGSGFFFFFLMAEERCPQRDTDTINKRFWKRFSPPYESYKYIWIYFLLVRLKQRVNVIPFERRKLLFRNAAQVNERRAKC